jgi:pimeloyl-ACP methyl ester carboxylesterase
MATYVLVHGFWHGGWCWKKIVPLLRAAGHDVLTPTLTGLGERRHLAHPGVNLDTHLTDVLNVLEYEDRHDVVLVGHSYGGMVITGVADRAPDRVRHLVFLDAVIPKDGDSFMTFVPAQSAAKFDEQIQTLGDGWTLPQGTPDQWGVTDATDIAWTIPRLAPQPAETFRQPLRLQHEIRCPATYILCTKPDEFAGFADKVRDQPGWKCREIPTGHDAMITMPQQLADLLLEAASVEMEAMNG